MSGLELWLEGIGLEKYAGALRYELADRGAPEMAAAAQLRAEVG